MPVWIPAMIAAGTALAGWLSSRQAQAASAEERKKVEDLLAKIQTPNFDASAIQPEEFAVVAKYVPQAAKVIQEEAPTLGQDSAAGMEGRQAELAALSKLRGIADGAPDIGFQAQMNDLNRQTQVRNNGQQQAIQESFARRGAGGSGMEMLAALSAQQNSGDDLAEQEERAAADAYRNRLSAMRDSADLGGRIQGADRDMSFKNAGMWNDYKARAAGRAQNVEMANVGAANEAGRYNTGVAQGVADNNVQARNTAAVQNRDRMNTTKDKSYQNELDKVRVQQGVSTGAQQDIRSNQKDTNSMISGAGSAGQIIYDEYGKPKKKKTGPYGEEDISE